MCGTVRMHPHLLHATSMTLTCFNIRKQIRQTPVTWYLAEKHNIYIANISAEIFQKASRIAASALNTPLLCTSFIEFLESLQFVTFVTF